MIIYVLSERQPLFFSVPSRELSVKTSAPITDKSPLLLRRVPHSGGSPINLHFFRVFKFTFCRAEDEMSSAHQLVLCSLSPQLCPFPLGSIEPQEPYLKAAAQCLNSWLISP